MSLALANLSGAAFSLGLLGVALAGVLEALTSRRDPAPRPDHQEREASMALYPTTGRAAIGLPERPFDQELDR